MLYHVCTYIFHVDFAGAYSARVQTNATGANTHFAALEQGMIASHASPPFIHFIRTNFLDMLAIITHFNVIVFIICVYIISYMTSCISDISDISDIAFLKTQCVLRNAVPCGHVACHECIEKT